MKNFMILFVLLLSFGAVNAFAQFCEDYLPTECTQPWVSQYPGLPLDIIISPTCTLKTTWYFKKRCNEIMLVDWNFIMPTPPNCMGVDINSDALAVQIWEKARLLITKHLFELIPNGHTLYPCPNQYVSNSFMWSTCYSEQWVVPLLLTATEVVIDIDPSIDISVYEAQVAALGPHGDISVRLKPCGTNCCKKTYNACWNGSQVIITESSYEPQDGCFIHPQEVGNCKYNLCPQ